MALEERQHHSVGKGETQTFRRVLGASSVSMLGSHVTTIAYPLLVLRLTGSPVTAGFIVFRRHCAQYPGRIHPGRRARRPVESQARHAVQRGRPRSSYRVGSRHAGNRQAHSGAIDGRRRYRREFSRSFPGSQSGATSRVCLCGPIRSPPRWSSIEARTHVVLVAGRPLGGLLFGAGATFPFLADAASFV